MEFTEIWSLAQTEPYMQTQPCTWCNDSKSQLVVFLDKNFLDEKHDTF